MTSPRLVVALAAALVAAVGCSQAPDVSRVPNPAGSSAASAPAGGGSGPIGSGPSGSGPNGSGGDLAERKKAAGIADCPASDPNVKPVEGGLPDVVLQCLGGGTPTRLAGLRGRPMLINVWAQWCQPCRQEAPFLAEIAITNDTDLMILGVDFNDPRPELAIDFAEVASWTYPQLADQDKAISAPLQLSNIPQTLLVDADGRVVHRHAGPFQSADQIRQLLRRHLGTTP